MNSIGYRIAILFEILNDCHTNLSIASKDYSKNHILLTTLIETQDEIHRILSKMCDQFQLANDYIDKIKSLERHTDIQSEINYTKKFNEIICEIKSTKELGLLPFVMLKLKNTIMKYDTMLKKKYQIEYYKADHDIYSSLETEFFEIYLLKKLNRLPFIKIIKEI